MDAFTTHTGTLVPLRRSNVDTDQIIPAAYLKRITRTGFGDGLFAAWRDDPDFVLNDPRYRDGSVLVVGPDFGIGSSREHAVWALQDHGFRVVIGSRFGDIFRTNAGKAGLLVALVDQDVVERLWQAAEAPDPVQVVVDLADQTITVPDGWSAEFHIERSTRDRLLAGLDEIGVSLSHLDQITAHEQARPDFLPTTGGGVR